jgi:hypothetical protein
MVEEYKNTPGLLLFYWEMKITMVFWDGAETENIPLEDRESTIRAHALYKLFNAIVEMKQIDKSHPMAICNGDSSWIS